MQHFTGRKLSNGVAAGRILFYAPYKPDTSRRTADDSAAECRRFEAAVDNACDQLDELYDKLRVSAGEENAEVFNALKLLLKDGSLNRRIKEMIASEKICAEYAVSTVCTDIERSFSEMDDEYMRQRSADIRDISQRLLKILSGCPDTLSDIADSSLIAASSLSASDIAAADKSKILGFITEKVSYDSHAAILMRAMNVPALTMVPADQNLDGHFAVIDAGSGSLIIDPDEDTMLRARSAIKESGLKALELNELKGKAAVTKSGRQIHLYANVGSLSDIETALDNDAEGVGLMRSEFIYLNSSRLPSEEEQFEIYKAAAAGLDPKPLILRTADLGSDKMPTYLEASAETNPALGIRGIRLSLQHPDMFTAQLRAAYRASAFGNIAIMLPMITSLNEVLECKRIADEVKNSLRNEGKDFDENLRFGIMIETPAAALISDQLAKEVDFFSIGTNDLTQYTLACDRLTAPSDITAPFDHPAVLELIRLTIENAHRAGIKAGICGEMAADTRLTQTLISLGADSLSVSPSFILPLKMTILNL